MVVIVNRVSHHTKEKIQTCSTHSLPIFCLFKQLGAYLPITLEVAMQHLITKCPNLQYLFISDTWEFSPWCNTWGWLQLLWRWVSSRNQHIWIEAKHCSTLDDKKTEYKGVKSDWRKLTLLSSKLKDKKKGIGSQITRYLITA